MPGWLLIWFVLIVTTLLTRGPMPIDETRYLAAAWEMWQRGDFLVPYLNAEPYSDKPPLLFWLFHGGWYVFGVNAWWPRLLPSLFVLASLFLARALGQRLWPQQAQAAELVPWLLIGSTLWAVFTTTIMFDMLLVFFTLAAVHGLWWASQRRAWLGWGLVGVATGLGILTKGPVVLLPIAFAALLAPWWSPQARRQPIRWYAGLAGALAIAAGIALAWAVPAAARGGPSYEQAILWHQTADRLVHSFAHQRPGWWYLLMLPLVLFPWLLWPTLWRALASLGKSMDSGVRLCLTWLIPTFVVFSFISGKQAHYLLPLFPALALLAAHALVQQPGTMSRYPQAPITVIFLLVGLMLSLLPWLSPLHDRVPWLAAINPLCGLVIVGLGLGLLHGYSSLYRSAIALATATALSIVTLQAGAMQAGWPYYDLRPLAQHIAALQTQDIPVAVLSKYHGEYQFLGRLKKPLEVIQNDQLADWITRHPNGRIVVYLRDVESLIAFPHPDYEQPYRSGQLQLWSAVDLSGQV